MPNAIRFLLLALNFLLISAPAWLQPRIGGDMRPFVATTFVVVAMNIALVLRWKSGNHKAHQEHKAPLDLLLLLYAVCAVALFWMASAWQHETLIQPIDPQRADMLVVIEMGVQRLFRGQDPYGFFSLPWKSALTYGPGMWLPYTLPYLLHADIRFVTLTGMLFVPLACATAVVVTANKRDWVSVAGWLAVLAAIGTNPDLRLFARIGHTPAYWPLLALFVWLIASKRWMAGAFVCGLLIAARTPMVSIAPVFLMIVWHEARPKAVRAAVIVAATTAIIFVPFALWDFAALRYGMYGIYVQVMRAFVWPLTTWVQHSVGITGWLIAAGWYDAVQIVQVLVMLPVYAACWFAIRSGRPALPWMGFALLAFSMTAVWPVAYIYFDVALFFVLAALAETPWPAAARPGVTAAVTLAGSIAIVVAVASVEIPKELPSRYTSLDHEEVLIPRLTRQDAVIDLECTVDSPQQFTATLNGTPLGTVRLAPGVQHVSMAASARLWKIGVNRLDPSFSGGVTRSFLGQVTVK